MKTRQKILDSAYELISLNGYNRTSIAMISDHIGIKKSLIYYYFKSKEDLFLRLIEEFLLGSNAQVFDFNVSSKEYKNKLLEFGNEFINSYKSDNSFSSS